MAARATWKGFLKISVVNIPIKVFPATESSGTISFHQLHGECQTRIQQKRWCPYHNREVPIGIGKLALYGREYLVAVRPQERGIVMYTLHHAAEIRSIDTVDELSSVATTVKRKRA